MKKILQHVLFRNAYIVLAAAWLFTIAFIVDNYRQGRTEPRVLRNAIEEYIHTQEKDFNNFVSEKVFIDTLIGANFTREELARFVEKPYALFLCTPDEVGSITLRNWNTQDVMPTSDLLNDNLSNEFVKLASGYYEILRREMTTPSQKKVLVIGLIPIYKEYYLETNNLQRRFVDVPFAEKNVSVSVTATAYPVRSSTGDTLFYLKPADNPKPVGSNWLVFSLVLIGIIFVLIFVHNAGLYVAETFGYARGIIFLVGVVLLLRSATYALSSLNMLRNFALFQPNIYSSNAVLASLGDLLINSLLFCWIVLFVRKVTEKKSFANYKNSFWQWPFLIISLQLLVVMTFIFAAIVQSLIVDGTISFNVTNFYSLTVYSFVGFIVLAALSFGYFFLAQLVLRFITPLLEGRQYWIYIITAFLGLLLLSFLKNSNLKELCLYSLLWLLVFIWLMKREVFSGLYSRLNISEVLFWLFIFSMSISVIVIYENQRKDEEQRKGMADKLAEQVDPSSEKLLNLSFAYLDNNFLSNNFYRFRQQRLNLELKDSIINRSSFAYLNKYDTKVYTFDNNLSGVIPLSNPDPVSFDTLNTIFNIEGKQLAAVPDLRYFEKTYEKFSYIYRKEVFDSTNTVIGYFFMIAVPKRYQEEALVPELFKRTDEYFPVYSAAYSYAIFGKPSLKDIPGMSDEEKRRKSDSSDLLLIESYNDYEFPITLRNSELPNSVYERRKNNGYDELWYRQGKERVVIIARKDNYAIEAITLFSYLFSTFLLLIAIFRIIALLIQSRLRWKYIRSAWQFDIRTQIHGTIIFISLFSFLVIGVATIIFFYNRYQRNNQDKLSKMAQVLSEEIKDKIRMLYIFDDETDMFASVSDQDLAEPIKNIAEIHGTEINLYSLEGNLRSASNQLIYDKGILSKKMNPEAYYNMRYKRLVQFVTQEQMADISYQSIYVPVRNEKGEPVCFLNIPYYDSQSELKREISNFLVTIINLNAFIFLIAGAIALFITNNITSSFTLIGEKMREINLGKMNEEIVWGRNDEIGGLVTEYNKMVAKLGESASALAKSEREGAWREMARQVAHEIKNPLTPMKLSIQYLQKAIDNNSENVKELSANVARTLIEQIDHLSKIAADFSQFANIGNVKNEVFDLHDMLRSLSLLYEATEHLAYSWHPVGQRILVFADKTQLNRLFTNLLQNAVEACHQRETPVVTVTEELLEDKVVIKVSDNGEGIPEATQSKIFTPNFTTKSSGTGLGLAMSKTIVEQAKGKIWFETKEAVGTTFFVELPVMRLV